MWTVAEVASFIEKTIKSTIEITIEETRKPYVEGIAKIASELRKVGLTKTADQIDKDLATLLGTQPLQKADVTSRE